MGHAPALEAAPADATAGGGNGRAAAAAAAVAPAASAAVAVAVSASEPPTIKRQGSEPEAGSDGRATGGDRAGSGRPPPRLQTKPYDDLRGHTGFLLFCTKHVGDGAAEA